VLVVTPNRTIGEQWADHFVRLTTLEPEDISLFADFVDDKPVAIMTYQALTSTRDGLSARMHDAGDPLVAAVGYQVEPDVRPPLD
jgi:superfamily II DNA or RNA helicase